MQVRGDRAQTRGRGRVNASPSRVGQRDVTLMIVTEDSREGAGGRIVSGVSKWNRFNSVPQQALSINAFIGKHLRRSLAWQVNCDLMLLYGR
jgi:hypothetical protein